MDEARIRIDPLDFEGNVAIGLKLPLNSSTNSFFALNYTSWDQLRSNLKNLLLTEKGERYMIPDYGAGLKKFIFEPNDDITLDIIEEYITETVNKWMPRININSVNITRNDRNEHQLNVSIKFSDKYDESNNDVLTIDFITM